MKYYIDKKIVVGVDKIRAIGWAISQQNEPAKIYVKNQQNETIDSDIEIKNRADLYTELNKNYDAKDDMPYGFDICFTANEKDKYYLCIETKEKTAKISISIKLIKEENAVRYDYKKNINHMQIILFLKNLFNVESFKRGIKILKKDGINGCVKKIGFKIRALKIDMDYDVWYKKTLPTDVYYENAKNDIAKKFDILPLLSIVIPIYDTNDIFLEKLFNSIYKQIYTNYEVCIVDATNYNNNKNNPKKFIENYLSDKKDFAEKIKIQYIENKMISENTNVALEMTSGDYVVFVDHDDEITDNALYEIVKAININKNVAFIYSDEDKIDENTNYFFEPSFKPNFSLDTLLSMNYICHLVSVKKNYLMELKKIYGSIFRKQYDGAQDYDLYLRLVEYLNKNNELENIYHIPKILYHWRVHKLSTSKGVNAKDYANDAQVNALKSFYEYNTFGFDKVKDIVPGIYPGIHKTLYENYENEKLLSIIIPNKDHIADLDKCLNSLVKSTYKNFEVIVVENNSVDEKTFEYYKTLTDKYSFKTNVVYYEGIFNYSKINNFGIKYAAGDYILLLNNDTEMIKEDSLYEMMHYINRKDVGAVGCKLLYDDDTLQHAGVTLGFGGIAGHNFVGFFDKQSSYMNRAQIVSNVTAVTAASLMTKKSVLKEVGGLNEDLEVAFNDIDLCMKIRRAGYHIVYDPYSVFYHYESKSRGYEDTKEKVERFNTEVAKFSIYWEKELQEGDPYYNPNLTLMDSDFSLKKIKNEAIGEPWKLPIEIQAIREKLKAQGVKEYSLIKG